MTVHRTAHAHGPVPQHDGVGEQAEAACLFHDHLEAGGAELTLVGKEQALSQAVAGLAAVELGLDAQAQRLIVQIAQDYCGSSPADRER